KTTLSANCVRRAGPACRILPKSDELRSAMGKRKLGWFATLMTQHETADEIFQSARTFLALIDPHLHMPDREKRCGFRFRIGRLVFLDRDAGMARGCATGLQYAVLRLDCPRD